MMVDFIFLEEKPEYVTKCKECKEGIVVDAKWKNLCTKCWLKINHPEEYEKRYLCNDIICERCNTIFVGALWKSLCPGCWLIDLNERKQEDLEEREQFDK